ncbi:MAG: peptidylprolyl isomerase [Saprospiraceae bacterium]
MLKQIVLGLLGLFLVPAILLAQKNDPILFTVEDTPVNLSEFQYIYSKTNGDKADFSKASLQEYLDLYVKFKLKVQRAKDMKLDTIPSLQKELAGYRQQLANSYLVDKEVTDRLVNEAYDRSKQEVDISHIMVAISSTASAKQEAKALQKINSLYAMLEGGDKFEDVVKAHTEDKYTQDKGGRLGYFAAMFRDGFYEMETAAYNLKKGMYSKPVRTAVGYHIIKVNNVRDARGEIEVAHILIRNGKDKVTPETVSKTAKVKIDNIYQLLADGQAFEAVAKANSEDNSSKDKGGVVGPLTTNSPVDERFKDVAFGLTKDGEYSKPFESSVGWHIVRRISKKESEPEDIAKRRLMTKIQKGSKGRRGGIKKFSRQQIAKDAMLNRIQREGKFKEDKNVYNLFVSKLDSTFLTHKWKKPEFAKDAPILQFGNTMTASVSEFADFAKRSSLRMRQRNASELKPTVAEIYSNFKEEMTIKYEESQLEKKYPEFKSLMREYEEGILLFEATKLLVWDKASQDTVGLKSFHEKNKKNYMWDERAEVSIYTVQADKKDKVTELRMAAIKKKPETMKENFVENNPAIAMEMRTFEKGKNKKMEGVEWKKGAVSKNMTNPRNKAVSFIKIEKILPPAQKTLKDARGYVIADYQDHLEKNWLTELKKTYDVEIDEKVFESMVKK